MTFCRTGTGWVGPIATLSFRRLRPFKSVHSMGNHSSRRVAPDDRQRTHSGERWALASCLRDPALPTPKSSTNDPSPNLSLRAELRTPDMILHPRLNLYHLPPKQRKKQDQEQDPGSQSDGDSEEEPAAKRAPLEASSVRTKHCPPELTVLDQWYGTLLPHIAPQNWHNALMHFLGSLSPAVHDGLRLTG